MTGHMRETVDNERRRGGVEKRERGERERGEEVNL